MQRRRAAGGGTTSIWRRAFDPGGPAGLNATAMLQELQLKARST